VTQRANCHAAARQLVDFAAAEAGAGERFVDVLVDARRMNRRPAPAAADQSLGSRRFNCRVTSAGVGRRAA